jgi:transcriptional regulator with XRE-family HTH domain
MQILKAETLGWWTRVLRESSNLSQEALAAASGLNTRTIQRIENGESSSVTTRRALARGLGYKKADTFDDAELAAKIEGFRSEIGRIGNEALAAQYPDRVRVPAERVRTGEHLGRLIEVSNAFAFHYSENLSDEAKSTAAALFDYARDYGDADELYSATQKISVYKDLGGMLRELEDMGAAAHSGTRDCRFVGDHWADKTPMRMSIAYLVVDLADREITEIWAGKRFQFGY